MDESNRGGLACGKQLVECKKIKQIKIMNLFLLHIVEPSPMHDLLLFLLYIIIFILCASGINGLGL